MVHSRWPSASDNLRRELKPILERLLQERGGTLPGGVTQSELNGMPVPDLFDLANDLVGAVDGGTQKKLYALFERARIPREEKPEPTP